MAIAIGLAAGPAVAEQDRAAARAHFRRGEEFYAREQWQAAFDAYQAAYRAAALPGFLFNMGQCKRKLGAGEEALGFFRLYLAELPDAPNRADAEALISELEAELPAAPPAEGPDEPEPVEPAPAETPAPAPEEDRAEIGPSAEPTGAGAGAIGLPAWLAAGGGVALLGAGVFFALEASAAEEDLADGALDCERAIGRCLALQEDGDRAATMRNVFLVAGGALVAGAAALAYLDLTAESPVAFAPAIDAHTIALGARGGF